MSSKDFLWDKGDFSEDKSGSREGENVFMYMGGEYTVSMTSSTIVFARRI